MFEDFEQRFLCRDVEGALVRGLLDPARGFSSRARIGMAVAYCREGLFGASTFADLMCREAPLAPNNAFDLGHGVRFSFVQEYAGCVDADLRVVVDDDASYADKTGHRCAHFVDGGITDSLGLRALLEMVEVVGGARDYLQQLGLQPPRRIAVVAVNASADERQGIDASLRQPSIEQTLNAVTNIQPASAPPAAAAPRR